MSFGTSNGSDEDDSEPELFITAKSVLELSSCSDSGVNVSDVSSYRPADHEQVDSHNKIQYHPFVHVLLMVFSKGC